MENDLQIEVAFIVRNGAGKQKAKISVQYEDNDWGDVLALEKTLIPPIMGALFAAGEVFNASQGIKPSSIDPGLVKAA